MVQLAQLQQAVVDERYAIHHGGRDWRRGRSRARCRAFALETIRPSRLLLLEQAGLVDGHHDAYRGLIEARLHLPHDGHGVDDLRDDDTLHVQHANVLSAVALEQLGGLGAPAGLHGDCLRASVAR